VAKKFAAYHFFALVLCACTEIAGGNPIFRALALAILMGTYPFNGWMDPFFMRVPAFFADVWLIVIRPVTAAFFLSTVANAINGENTGMLRTTSLILAWLSLGLVPLMFFARLEMRRLVACLACWQSGYLWLFAAYFPSANFAMIALLAIVQGIFIAIIANVSTNLFQRNGTDHIGNLDGLFGKDYFFAIFILSSLIFLATMPLVFPFKNPTMGVQSPLLFQILGSMPIPLLFCGKVYGLMGGTMPRNCGLSS
jgi:hypothetical protein